MSKAFIVVLGMALVTYIPRVLPFIMISNKTLPKKLKLFLEYIPYAALGALLFPNVFTAIEGHLNLSILGLLSAGILAWKKDGLILPVLGSISVIYLLLGV